MLRKRCTLKIPLLPDLFKPFLRACVYISTKLGMKGNNENTLDSSSPAAETDSSLLHSMLDSACCQLVNMRTRFGRCWGQRDQRQSDRDLCCCSHSAAGRFPADCIPKSNPLHGACLCLSSWTDDSTPSALCQRVRARTL